MSNFWRVRPVESLISHAEKNALHRSLSALDLTLLGIGAIIGTGIFVLTGVGAAKAGPGLSLAFVAAGFACVFAALAYAELASMVPVSGSAYTYSYASMGEAMAWLIGWNLVLEYAVSAGAVAAGWSGYMVGIIEQAGLQIPDALHTVPQNGGILDLPAVLISLFITGLLVIGTKESAQLNRILVAIKISVVLMFLVLAVGKVDTGNWDPFLPFGWFERVGEGETRGVFAAAAVVFFAYIGFDAVSTASEEAVNPNRDVPIGLIASLIVCTVLYIAVSLVATGAVPFTEIAASKEPLALILREIGFGWAATLLALGAVAGITTVLLVLVYGQTRIFFVMSRDRLLPDFVSKLHPKYGTPYVITIITGVFVALVAGFYPLDKIAELSNIGTLFAFIAVAIGVMILRRTDPDRPRAFRVAAYWLVCPLAIVSCGALMYFLPLDTWIRFALWSAFGMAIYALYGYRRSTLHPRNIALQRVADADAQP